MVAAWGLAAAVGTPTGTAAYGLGFSLLAVPLLVLTAALGATLPPPSTDLLAMGDGGAMAFGTRLFAGPQLTALAVLAPTVLVLLTEDQLDAQELLTAAAIWTGVVGVGLTLWLRNQLQPEP